MTISNLFAYATRKKLRFPIGGQISVEDVWDLPLKAKREGQPSLDELAQTLDDQVRASPRRSFVDDEGSEPSEKSLTQIKLDIVLAVIAVKKEEANAKETAVVRAGQARVLDEAIQRKKDEKLGSMTLEELEVERAKLNA